jgi:hypothetical protein
LFLSLNSGSVKIFTVRELKSQLACSITFNRVDDLQKPIENPGNINWESYARGAVYALQNSGYDLRKVYPFHPCDSPNYPRLQKAVDEWLLYRV